MAEFLQLIIERFPQIMRAVISGFVLTFVVTMIYIHYDMHVNFGTLVGAFVIFFFLSLVALTIWGWRRGRRSNGSDNGGA